MVQPKEWIEVGVESELAGALGCYRLGHTLTSMGEGINEILVEAEEEIKIGGDQDQNSACLYQDTPFCLLENTQE